MAVIFLNLKLLYFQNWKWIHLKGKVGKKAGRSLKQNKKRQEEPEIRQSCECARVIIIFVSLKTRITLAELLLFFFLQVTFLKKKQGLSGLPIHPSLY